jgi:hypothetical protein
MVLIRVYMGEPYTGKPWQGAPCWAIAFWQKNPISRTQRAGLLHAHNARKMGQPINCSLFFSFLVFRVFLAGFVGWVSFPRNFSCFSVQIFEPFVKIRIFWMLFKFEFKVVQLRILFKSKNCFDSKIVRIQKCFWFLILFKFKKNQIGKIF